MDQAAADTGAIPTPNDEGEAAIFVLAKAVWRHWRILCVTIPLTLLLAIIHLWGSTPVYEASAVVFPSATTETETRRITPTGQALGLFDATRGTPTPFDKFFAVLKTPEFAIAMDQQFGLAKKLYKRQWDETSQQWKTPQGVGAWVRRLMGWEVYPFDPIAALTTFFSSSLGINQVDKRVSLMTLSFTAVNRQSAQDMLTEVLDTARQILITQKETELTHDIAYLTDKLQTVDLVEHRVQLGQLLADQEREMMLLKAGSYGADVLQPVYTPATPRYPEARTTLLLAFGFGLIAGTAIALVLALREM
jgi:hypothetical protein